MRAADPEPVPSERLVRWTPRKLGALAAEVTTPADLCFESRVFHDLRRQVADAPDGRAAGLLLGRRHESAGSARPTVLVQASAPIEPDAPGEDGALHRALESLKEELDEAADLEVVGWYHSHSLLGVFLSERDSRFHEQHFPAGWNCALILVQDRSRPAGGVFQPTESLGLRRSIYVPFYEVLSADARTTDGRVHSEMDWNNYVTDADVVVRSLESAAPAPREGAGVPGETEPGGEVDARDEDVVRDREELARHAAGGGPAAAGSMGARMARRAAAGEREEDAPAGDRPRDADPEPAAGAARAPDPRIPGPPRGGGASWGRPGSGPAGYPPRPDGDLPADIPVVIPGDDTRFDGARRRKLLGAAIVAVGVALVAWLLWPEGGSDPFAEDPPAVEVEGGPVAERPEGEGLTVGAGGQEGARAGEPPTGEGTGTTAEAAAAGPGRQAPQDEAGQGAGPPPSAAEEAGRPAPRQAEPAPPGGQAGAGAAEGTPTPFDEALEAYDAAVAGYASRRREFTNGNVGCTALGQSYRRVDEAFLTLSARLSGASGNAAARYDEAASRMEAVDRHFDASGCPRPQ